MKKLKLNALSLDKETIALLDDRQLQEIVGGNGLGLGGGGSSTQPTNPSLQPSGGSTGCGSGGSTCGRGNSTGCGSGSSTCFAG